MSDCLERPMVASACFGYVGGVRRDASTGLCGGFGWTAAGILQGRAVRLVRTVAADQIRLVLIWQLFDSAHKSAAEKS